MHKLGIQCCHDPALQFPFERDESKRFGFTVPRPSAALGLLWCNSCIGDTGLLSQACPCTSAGEITPTQLLFCSGYRLELAFPNIPLSWFGFGEVLGIGIVLVHIESSSCSPDNSELSPLVGRRSHHVFLKEKMMEMKRRISVFLFKCKVWLRFFVSIISTWIFKNCHF